MRVALINENSQSDKNEIIYNSLSKICKKYNHTLINIGMKNSSDNSLTYVEVGLMSGILLNSGAVDFIVSGCGTGEGAMMAINSFPNCFCGLIYDPTNAYLFRQINDGNAVSIPYAYNFGWGAELTLDNIFNELFKSDGGYGYPKERSIPEKNNRDILTKVKKITTNNMLDILNNIDKELLSHIVKNKVFMDCLEKYGKKEYIEVLKKYE